MAVEAGTRLGRFVVHEYIGQGTLGTVYRALDAEQGSVAVKVLHRLGDAETRERLSDAAPQLTEVRHPNLVSVVEVGEHDEVPYVIQEYVPGVTLAERFRRATVSPITAVRVLRHVAEGLDHAHASGLVHGNLKPDQVLLCADDPQGDNCVALADIGLAPLRRPRLTGLAVGVADATPEYLAPEQVAGHEPTAASDRYALAVIAYQLLVDRPPFEGDPQTVSNAHLKSRAEPPSRRNRAVPVAADVVLLRGLAKEQDARWATATELVEALADALGITPEPPPQPEGPDGQRHLVTLAAGGVAVFLAAGTAVGALASRSATDGPVALRTSHSLVMAGDTVALTATHLPADEAVAIRLQGQRAPLGWFRADERGVVSGEVSIPASTGAGEHDVAVCRSGGDMAACPARAPLQVVAPPPANAPVVAPMRAVPPPNRPSPTPRGLSRPRPAPPSSAPAPAQAPTPAPSVAPASGSR